MKKMILYIKKVFPYLLFYRVKFLVISFLGYLFNNESIIVYQMGKVGSTTVYETLKRFVRNPIFHVHFLNIHELLRVQNKYKKASVNTNPSHIVFGKLLSKRMHENNKKWNIITLVREPISLKLSHLFHNPRVHRPYLFDEKGILDKNKALEIANETIANLDVESDYVFGWFKKEFNDFLKINILDNEFDKKKRYKVFHTPKYKILVLQTEAIDSVLIESVKELGIKYSINEVIRSNENNDKEFSEIYSYVKNNISIDDDTFDRIYGSNFMKHFYSQEAINEFKKKWAKS